MAGSYLRFIFDFGTLIPNTQLKLISNNRHHTVTTNNNKNKY